MMYDCRDTSTGEPVMMAGQEVIVNEPAPTFVYQGWEQDAGDPVLLLVCVNERQEVTVHRHGPKHPLMDDRSLGDDWEPEAMARVQLLAEAIPEDDWFLFRLDPYRFYHGEEGKAALEALNALMEISLTRAPVYLEKLPRTILWTNQGTIRRGRNERGSVEVGDGISEPILDPDVVDTIRADVDRLVQ